jgi:hypothetical protein
MVNLNNKIFPVILKRAMIPPVFPRRCPRVLQDSQGGYFIKGDKLRDMTCGKIDKINPNNYFWRGNKIADLYKVQNEFGM